MEVMERAVALEREGARVLHLEVGEPDFPPPPPAVDACAKALQDGETRYTDSRGLLALREAIARDCGLRHGVDVDPERVLVTSGSSAAMMLVFSLLVDPGDEVIVATPHYPCYPSFVRACGGEPVFLPCDPARGYPMDVDAVRALRTPRTRALIVASPANPTGAIQSEETLRDLATLGLPIISDEVYHGLVYDGPQPVSALRVSEEVYALDGFSKRYAMTGFRLGWLVAPLEAMRELRTLQQNLFISANRFVQHAGLAALSEGAETLAAMCTAYRRRRDLLVDGLRSLGLEVPVPPAGAIYVFADARSVDGDSRRLAFELLERAHVGVAPGVDFGAAGEGWLRFCCAASEVTIEEALERLGRVLPELR